MHLRFQANAGHAQGLFDAILIVDDVILRQNMQHFPVHGDRHRFGCVDDPIEVPWSDLFIFDGDNAVAVKSFDMATRDPRENRVDLAASHQLRFFHGLFDGVHRALDVDDHALSEALRGVRPHPDHFHAMLGHFADNGTDF